MTLTVKLDDEMRDRLAFLIGFMNVTNQSEVIRKLINDRFDELQADKTLVERRGGHPKRFAVLGAELSDRSNRKPLIAKKIAEKRKRRRS